MLESIKQIIKAPTHTNIVEAIKCIGFFTVTLIVLVCKLAGFIVKLLLHSLVAITKAINKVATWLLDKLNK
jgi:hypothetical protein